MMMSKNLRTCWRSILCASVALLATPRVAAQTNSVQRERVIKISGVEYTNPQNFSIDPQKRFLKFFHSAGIAKIPVDTITTSDVEQLPDLPASVRKPLEQVVAKASPGTSGRTSVITVPVEGLPTYDFGARMVENVTAISYEPQSASLTFRTAQGILPLGAYELSTEELETLPEQLRTTIGRTMLFPDPRPTKVTINKPIAGSLVALVGGLYDECGLQISVDPMLALDESAFDALHSGDLSVGVGDVFGNLQRTIMGRAKDLTVLAYSSNIWFITWSSAIEIEKARLATMRGDRKKHKEFMEASGHTPLGRMLSVVASVFERIDIEVIESLSTSSAEMDEFVSANNATIKIYQDTKAGLASARLSGNPRQVQNLIEACEARERQLEELRARKDRIVESVGGRLVRAAKAYRGIERDLFGREESPMALMPCDMRRALAEKLKGCNRALAMHFVKLASIDEIDTDVNISLNSSRLVEMGRTEQSSAVKTLVRSFLEERKQTIDEVDAQIDKIVSDVSVENRASLALGSIRFDRDALKKILRRPDGGAREWDLGARVWNGLSHSLGAVLQRRDVEAAIRNGAFVLGRNAARQAQEAREFLGGAKEISEVSIGRGESRQGTIQGLVVGVSGGEIQGGKVQEFSVTLLREKPSGKSVADLLSEKVVVPRNLYCPAVQSVEGMVGLDMLISMRDALFWALAQPGAGEKLGVTREDIEGDKREFGCYALLNLAESVLSTAVDGPCAGVPFAAALYSAITQRGGNMRVAVTGALAPNGRVSAIGACSHKIRAAHDKGCDFVFIPAANADAVSLLDLETLLGIQVVSISNMDGATQFLAPDKDGSERLASIGVVYASALASLEQGKVAEAAAMLEALAREMPSHLSARRLYELLKSRKGDGDCPEPIKVLLREKIAGVRI